MCLLPQLLWTKKAAAQTFRSGFHSLVWSRVTLLRNISVYMVGLGVMGWTLGTVEGLGACLVVHRLCSALGVELSLGFNVTESTPAKSSTPRRCLSQSQADKPGPASGGPTTRSNGVGGGDWWCRWSCPSPNPGSILNAPVSCQHNRMLAHLCDSRCSLRLLRTMSRIIAVLSVPCQSVALFEPLDVVVAF